MRLPQEIEVVKGTHVRANFMIAIPTLGLVPIEFMLAFSRLQMPMNGQAMSTVIKGMEVGEARNYIANAYYNMEDRPDYLLFIGDDMLPEWDGLIRLYNEMKTGKWDVLAGLYYIKNEPPTPVAGRKECPGGIQPFKDYIPGDAVDVDLCGMDFTLIRKEVFDKIESPFFKTGPDMNKEGGIDLYTEDEYFCRKVLKAGMRVGVHTGVKVGHLYHKNGEVF